MKFQIALVASLLPAAVFAAGTGTPTQTQTSQDCTGSQIYDAETKTCVDSRDSRLDDADRIEGARELASFGRAEDALRVLATLNDATTADALTTRGYATRKAGDFDAGVALYHAALALDPDHWQARSYLGQGLLERGDRAAAQAQLTLIRAGGARGTWPEVSLVRALGGNATY
ncbi:tetratricopeptide repeat protein [Jannaschia donghaensis]|uniref:Putative O-linked N-acetylglucosamine transferase, SPINDLY family n=1 Tax=Jannaschia donghaensis TaxID=420998 RepID=A0A0M6YFE9_9RHOB|nr:tetratricopeptide repeat protein [Jannaschia donghaensis]CTQ48664.1 putative O-linked N-acetylglucosamine transferase, SPINDLY family [Jannaschia donghaensis]